MKVFITGATGFLGSALAKLCLDRGFEVKALRRPTSTNTNLAAAEAQIEWVHGDLDDTSLLAESFQGVDVVFHCAAFIGFDGVSSPALLHSVNVDGTANVVNAALEARVNRLIHVSSIAALGRILESSIQINEDAEWVESPLNTAYAVSKHRAELEIQRGVAEGLEAVIINPSLIMGPGKKGANTMQIAERIYRRKLGFMPIGGTNVVDVDDVALAALAAMENGVSGERYIIGGHNMMWREILPALAEAMHVPPPKRIISRRLLLVLASASETLSSVFRLGTKLTRDAARVSSSVNFYSNAKAISELKCGFRPFSETAKRIAEAVKNG